MPSARPGRPLHPARTPAQAKAEAQVDARWGNDARRLIKEVMDERGWGYRELAEQLAVLGVEMEAPTLNRRINRGNFSAAFLLMCLTAMGAGFEVQTAPAKKGGMKRPAVGGRVAKPVQELAAIALDWTMPRKSR